MSRSLVCRGAEEEGCTLTQIRHILLYVGLDVEIALVDLSSRASLTGLKTTHSKYMEVVFALKPREESS